MRQKLRRDAHVERWSDGLQLMGSTSDVRGPLSLARHVDMTG
jgi:hypothetical protein